MLFVLLFSCLSHDPITFYPFLAGALVSLAEDEEDDEVPLIMRR